MVVGMLLYSLVVWAWAYKHPIHNYFDEAIIPARPGRGETSGSDDAQSSETEALHEGYAQKGFGVLGIALDGSPFPLGSTATNETTDVFKTLWIRKQGNPKQMNISDNQQPSGDKRWRGCWPSS
jgi:hypothetical protein